MKDNELNSIWKSQIKREIKPYSISELDNMIVKNARHSMFRLFPGLKIKVVLSVLVIVYLLLKVIAEPIDFSLKIFYSMIIVIIAASWILAWRGLRKIQTQNPAIPVREWLKEKITDLDKSIAYQKKYDVVFSVGLAIFIVGIFITHNYIQNGIMTLLLFLPALIAVFITLYFSRIRKKRFKEVRSYLQSLYEQL